jgi:VIT1/CCC1 family predicted Fe2+/Mn2+ transporter
LDPKLIRALSNKARVKPGLYCFMRQIMETGIIKPMSQDLQARLLGFQRNEITEHIVYLALAARSKEEKNREVFRRIAAEEMKHYEFWKARTGKDVAPKRLVASFYIYLARFLGITFATKLMERGERLAQGSYQEVVQDIPEVTELLKDEEAHELAILRMTHDRVLVYVSSIVLGLNDALVELTGALAGFTLAFRESSVIALAGFITGIAASLSMAAAEFMSTRAERNKDKDPYRAALYTGVAYILVVLALVAPFFITANIYAALGSSILIALAVIVGFSFYVSVAQEVSFKEHVLTMGLLSLGVAAISFGIGYLAQRVLHVNI